MSRKTAGDIRAEIVAGFAAALDRASRAELEALSRSPVLVIHGRPLATQAGAGGATHGPSFEFDVAGNGDVSATEPVGRRRHADTLENRAAIAARLGRAASRGAAAAGSILASTEMVSADTLGAMLDLSRTSVHAKRKQGDILGLRGAKRDYRFPVWQVMDHRLVDGLAALHRRFDGDSWAVFTFLRMHHPELSGLTGVEGLRRGRVADVLAAADNFGDSFA